MGLESITSGAGSTIADLNSDNPASGDEMNQGDDHLRNIKKAIKLTFPNISATVSGVASELAFAHKGGTVSGAAMIKGNLDIDGALTVSSTAIFKTGIKANTLYIDRSATISGSVHTTFVKAGGLFANSATISASLRAGYVRTDGIHAASATISGTLHCGYLVTGGTTTDGGTTVTGGGSSLTAIRHYTSNGTWPKPANLVYAIIEVVGGGGGGGGSHTCVTGYSSDSGGGGGGAYAKAIMTSAELSDTVAIIIGAGGTGGSGGDNPLDGGNGGTSSFGAYVTASPGVGGTADTFSTTSDTTALGGDGGYTTTGADIEFPGLDGEAGRVLDGGSAMSGRGGRSFLSHQVRTSAENSNGKLGSSPGGGGSGASSDSGSGIARTEPGRTGGAGAPGAVFIHEYTT